ncbi:MAG: transposon-encoded TnpW family protein [Lachnospiraceae bacterium]|nr:transposon-encoded TnpW family protein [Lachnospiraceae bacterium]
MEQFGKLVCEQQSTTAEGNQKKLNYYNIGGATYLVSSHYKESGNSTVMDKVARLIDKDTETA